MTGGLMIVRGIGVRTARTVRRLRRGTHTAKGVVALLVVLLFVRALVQGSDAARESATHERLGAVAGALLGNPSTGTFGYVGDIGGLPESLDDLMAPPPGIPRYRDTHVGRVGMGWWGPYVDRRLFPGGDFTDEWGQPLEFGGRSGAGHGRTGPGQVRSGGPDRTLGTADDLLVPPYPVEIAGRFLMTVWVNGVPNPRGVTVTMYETVDGSEAVNATSTVRSDFNGFAFSVHHGVHAVRVTHRSNRVQGVVVKEPVTVDRVLTVEIEGRKQFFKDVYLATTADVVM